MKIYIFYTAIIIAALIASCKKDNTTKTTTNNNNNNNSTTNTVLAKDSIYNGTPSNTQVRLYEYDNSKRLVKIKYYSGTPSTYNSFDSIFFDVNGNVSKVINFTAGVTPMPTDTAIYSYSSGALLSIVSSTDSIYLFYASGKVSQYYHYYQGGTHRDTIASIVYTNNNASSVVVDRTPETINTDLTAADPYFGVHFLIPNLSDLINPNNITTVYPTATPGTKVIDQTYTYSNGKVSRIVDNKNILTKDITYKTL